MTTWPDQPVIMEINTWVWLEELRGRHGPDIDLGSVPDGAWDAAVPNGVDAVWLMGVWERSPAGTQIARRHDGVRADVEAVVPHAGEGDIVGSPYCISDYTVAAFLGGDAALSAARAHLHSRGVRLLVDYVPNHVARDHPWVAAHPDFFVTGTSDDLARAPDAFAELDGRVVALGRDPYFPAWTDVAQLNAFAPGLRAATAEQLCRIAERADGARCDMAMLLLNDVFAGTWGEWVGAPPPHEFWPEIIRDVRDRHPDFLFAAEAYWDLQPMLLDQGFDYCYDKRLYDVLVHPDPAAVREHLAADLGYQRRMIRFLENHDEPRAASALPADALSVASVAVATLPGALLLYEGQLERRTVRPPVQLGRRPNEQPDLDLRAFWLRLLAAVTTGPVRRGEWTLLRVEGWPDNDSHKGLVAWRWDESETTTTVVVNLSPRRADGRVQRPADRPAADPTVLTDVLTGKRFERDPAALAEHGLYVELPAWGFHVLGGRW